MHLTHLSLTNFRLFNRLDMELPRRVLLLVGNNAQGKTTLLEAVYFLSTFTSFHASSDRQLINFLATREPLAVSRLVAEYQRQGHSHQIETRLILENNRLRKEILCDGVRRNMHDAVGNLNAVMFLPQMTRIIEGSPEERRRFLNLLISQAIPDYSRTLSEYNQALSQRNALLKQISERGGNNEQLDFWDDALSQHGASIIHTRIRTIDEVQRLATRIHHQLTGGHEILRLEYQPAYDPLPTPPVGQYSLPMETQSDRTGLSNHAIQSGFISNLQAIRTEEIHRGVTTIGPHRDELTFMSNGINLGIFGSRGQVRTTMMSLKLAEAAWIKQKTSEFPVLLLDEILAELDIRRRADILNFLEESEQAMLTTTDLDLFDNNFVKGCSTWQVESGRAENSDPNKA
jgi:DNA replication and repair protein RecF